MFKVQIESTAGIIKFPVLHVWVYPLLKIFSLTLARYINLTLFETITSYVYKDLLYIQDVS